MKTFNQLAILLSLLITISVTAQDGINYKALVKDGSGNVVSSQSITVQFQILQGEAMTNIYQETHSPTTDANGIILAVIGEGSVDNGIYADIDWGADEYFLNVQIDTGEGLTDMGTSQFMAVPYALYASNAASRIDELSDGKSDSDGTNNGSSLFLGVNAGLSDDSSDNKNVGVGFETLHNNTIGQLNTAVGYRSLYNSTSGNNNTAVGALTLSSNTIGNGNTAVGTWALINNTEGGGNTAIGPLALFNNSTGSSNVANGQNSLYSNTSGGQNTANGFWSLSSNTIGSHNVANGGSTLQLNTTGSYNTANGHSALIGNTTGNYNTANGYHALYGNVDGIDNVASGSFSLHQNTSGYSNTSNGNYALENNTTGYENTGIGYQALSGSTTGHNNTAVGFDAQVPSGTSSNQVQIGNTFVSYAGIQVAWTVTSDERWKEQIRALPYGLEVVKELKPVDYLRKNNEHKTREMGFIAQDVEKLLSNIGYADQGFLSTDDKGYISLRYNDLIALLTKAIQEQQEIIETQDRNYKNLLKRVEQLELAGNH